MDQREVAQYILIQKGKSSHSRTQGVYFSGIREKS